MKIQDLAIIFVLIILPISLVLSAYTQYQIQTLNTQTLYDTQLTAATYDAIKAYQINAENSTTSELSNSKVRDIEASVSTFKNSIMSSFRLNGYSEEELDNYIPALVYTMYDGFYIYSPYENVNYQYEEKKDASGNTMTDINGDVIYDTTKPTQGNGDNIYGLKPYIPYSCRYKKGSIDVIITYALDNHIVVQGTIDGKYVNESGYLIDGITVDTSTDKVYYNGIEIKTEQLKEYFIGSTEHGIQAGVYPYVKLNGTKYYLIEDPTNGNEIIYLSNGTVRVQCKDTGKSDDEYFKYKTVIENNNQAIQYYKSAKEFTDKVRSITGLNLTDLTYGDAYDVDGNTKLWPGNTTKIFTGTTNIENELSNFNQHRLEVIRHTIESNLSLAIANYNNYSKSTTNDFQMPKLKEDEWDYITHNISLISFLQGLPIGGKIYNGYTIVTNSESKEVILEPNIYILGKDSSVNKTYHKIGDKELENTTISVDIGNYTGETDSRSSGRLNLDFRRKLVIDNNNTKYYYPLQDYNASYTSVVMQDKVNPKSYDDIYEYIDTECEDDVKTAFYIALARERQGQYKNNIASITPTTCIITYDAKGGSVSPSSKIVNAGETVKLPTPTMTGYKFLGWSTPTGEVYDPGDIYTVNSNMTFTANWKIIQYTVIYDAKGGNVLPSSETVNIRDTVELPTPTMAGYNFEGWSTPAGELYDPGDIYTVTSNITFTANWKAIQYTITYNANGGTGAPSSQTATYLSQIQLSTQVPTRLGYEFVGWARSPYSQEAEYQPGSMVSAENMTLYAIWSVTITYNANGGTGAPPSQTAIYLSETQLSTQIPTRPGYTFEGWARSQQSPGAQYQAGSMVTAENMTLYAIWSVTIIYNANGGTGAPLNQTAIYSLPTELSTQVPTKQGYDFVGWAKDSNATSAQYSAGDIVIAENMTLYAVWNKDNNPYIPTGFEPEEGTDIDEGFTIKDSLGNEYVWVEVPQTTEVYPTAGLAITEFTDDEYTAIENDLHTYTSVYRNDTKFTDTYSSYDATGLTKTKYNELKQKMLKSVYQNGGFYVGKYETGIEDAPKTYGSLSTAPTQTPVIKQNAYPYNNVTCKQAQTLASNMKSGEYTSSLMFGVQWDLVLKYLETKQAATQSELKSNSTYWGNCYNNNWTISNSNSKYSTNGTSWTRGLYNGGSKGSTSKGILLSTGASDDFSKQGIYDLAGNVLEWTLESTYSSRSLCASRGGGYSVDGDSYPASCHDGSTWTFYSYGIGFRVALY